MVYPLNRLDRRYFYSLPSPWEIPIEPRCSHSIWRFHVHMSPPKPSRVINWILIWEVFAFVSKWDYLIITLSRRFPGLWVPMKYSYDHIFTLGFRPLMVSLWYICTSFGSLLLLFMGCWCRFFLRRSSSRYWSCHTAWTDYCIRYLDHGRYWGSYWYLKLTMSQVLP